jgi:hypothetical protein
MIAALVVLYLIVAVGFTLVLHQQRQALTFLVPMLEALMSVETDLQADLDDIQAGIITLNTRLIGLVNQVTTLQTQVAAGGPVSQAQLDELVTEAAAIRATLDPLVTPPLAQPALTAADVKAAQAAAAAPPVVPPVVPPLAPSPFVSTVSVPAAVPVGVLTQSQIDNLTKAQAAALTSDQLAAMTSAQVAQVSSLLAS